MAYKFNPFTGKLDDAGNDGAANPGGSNTHIQFNDNGYLGGDVDLTWNKTTNVMTVAGDVNLSDGGSFTTTLQTITPTANRTVSIPDATGTLALVAGSSGQLLYNNAGANAGVSTMTFDGTSVTLAGRVINSYTSVASSPAKVFTGTWFTGGTATTTKPHFLIEPSGTTSTAWSTSGTGLGVNAASGFTGNLLDLQVNGTSRCRVTTAGEISCNNSGANGGLVPDSSFRGTFIKDNTGSTLIASTTSLQIRSGAYFGISSDSTFPEVAADVRLFRDAAGTLAQRNGGTSASPVAQTFRLYNFSVNPASDYERAFLRWSSNVLEIGTEGAGTGSAKPVRITAATLKLPNLPTYADNAAAITGGLVAGDVYKTATGELRITV